MDMIGGGTNCGVGGSGRRFENRVDWPSGSGGPCRPPELAIPTEDKKTYWLTLELENQEMDMKP